MSLLRSRPMARQSAKAKDRASHLAKVKAALLKRANFRCELCGAKDERLDLHHVFGRSGLGVWNDSLECVACLCRTCHERVTNPVALSEVGDKNTLQEEAVARLAGLAAAAGCDYVGYLGLDGTPLRAAIWLVIRLEAGGVWP